MGRRDRAAGAAPGRSEPLLYASAHNTRIQTSGVSRSHLNTLGGPCERIDVDIWGSYSRATRTKKRWPNEERPYGHLWWQLYTSKSLTRRFVARVVVERS